MKKLTLLALLLVPTLAAASWFGWSSKDVTEKPTQSTPIATSVQEAPEAKPTAWGGSQNPYEAREGDIVYGNLDAPVTILEYASMTCNHCANFHEKVLSKLKATVVKDGTAKVVFRDLPWDNTALAVSQVVRCAAPENRPALLSAFFDDQKQWMTAQNPLNAIKAIAAMAGNLNGQQVEACVRDPKLRAEVLATKQEAQQKLGVKATPTVFVNGKMVEKAFDTKSLIDLVRNAARVIS